MDDRILNFIREHRGKILGGLIGFLVAVLLLEFGFWKCLFIAICVCIGLWIGSKSESRDRFMRYLAELFTNGH